MVVGNCNMRDESGRITAVNRPARFTLLNFMKGREYPWNPSACFYHKLLHENIGRYDETNDYTMDLDFLLRVVTAAPILYFDEVWGNFRWRPGAKTFEDAKAGMMYKRIDALREEYYHQLRWAERVHLGMFRPARSVYRFFKRGFAR